MGSERVKRRLARFWAVVLVVPLVVAAVGIQIAPTAAVPLGSSSLTIQQQWTARAAGYVEFSSPNVANLPGGPAVVVGDESGYVNAFYLANGAQVPGWPYNAGAPVESTPSVAPAATGSLDSVFVSVGDAQDPYVGGYQAITPQGGNQWFVQESNPSTDPYPHNGVMASMAVGDLQGGTDVVAGSLGEEEYAMTAGSGGVLPGFPWFQADSSFSTPALDDLYGNGQDDIIEGNASSQGFAYGTQYQNGGHLRVLNPTGNVGQPQPSGGLVCQYTTNQVVQSSPAVGDILDGGSAIGIVAGFGSYFSGASDTDQLIAIDSHCNLRWEENLGGSTTSSPALADVLGNGQLQVVENAGGTVWVLNGTTGQPIWHEPAGGSGSVVTADLTGTGAQDIIVPSYSGDEILDGRTGKLLATLPAGSSQNAPLVTEDPNGTIGITVAGAGGITHYEISGSDGSSVNGAGAWPMFHHDPQLTGTASSAPASTQVPCTAPAGTPYGYYMSGSDGGIFNFGNLPFCGSTGSIALNKPVVGLAATPDAGGYWEVASDGGLFAFGDAAFHGSMGGQPLNKPVVGMAVTPSGEGYWEVASDGGLFAFGDAAFHGSMGGQLLNEPIVGMAVTPTGGGYWEVASDGGLFAFGNAQFHGSMGGQHLNKPIVGMAATPTGGGYWEVASDGGLFAFGNAQFYGSMGGQHLNKSIVGMAATPTGGGYWEVASDGGLFAFGNAQFYGSMGGQPLNKPVVGIAVG